MGNLPVPLVHGKVTTRFHDHRSLLKALLGCTFTERIAYLMREMVSTMPKRALSVHFFVGLRWNLRHGGGGVTDFPMLQQELVQEDLQAFVHALPG